MNSHIFGEEPILSNAVMGASRAKLSKVSRTFRATIESTSWDGKERNAISLEISSDIVFIIRNVSSSTGLQV
jgi:hypothetical protein